VGIDPFAVAIMTGKTRTCRSRSHFTSRRFFTYSTANCKVSQVPPCHKRFSFSPKSLLSCPKRWV